MSDLVGNSVSWFSHAKAQIKDSKSNELTFHSSHAQLMVP